MITIDGSFGEGGGQIVRTSLALALVTGKPFRIENIRGKRKKPGLLRQHLTALNAAAEIGNAQVSGNHLGGDSFTFSPKALRQGRYHFAVGTAGSATLVLQAVLPALLVASGPSELILEGGTHNPWAPPFDFLDKAFLPLINRMGPAVTASLERPGFYPAGGGRFRVQIVPAASLTPLELLDRGKIVCQRARAMVAKLAHSIAKRELKVVHDQLSWPKEWTEIVSVEDAVSPGNSLFLEIQSEALTEVFTGFGKRGVPAERVAEEAIQQASAYLASEAPVGRYLADQLLIPLALAGGGAFKTLPPSQHTLTNAEVIQRFLDVNIQVDAHEKGTEIRIQSG